MMAPLRNVRTQLLIVLGAAALFLPGLGAVHLFDWDEINFAEIAREMLVTGDWSQPRMAFEPFTEKPPLFIWMQATAMWCFGVGELAARLPNAICGMVTLLVLFRMGTRLRNRIFGSLWALAYAGSILPHLYFHSGIIDPWFNLFIFLGLDAVMRTAREDMPPATGAGDRWAALAGLYLGLAVMTKGPVGILIPGIVVAVYWVLRRAKPVLRWRSMAIAAIVLTITIGTWAVTDLVRNGPEFMLGFFHRQVAMLTTEDAGHGGFFGYHFVVLLLGCFPASVFALQELLHPAPGTADQKDQRRWMVILFWTVLILFSIVRTKIIHYSSLCYFPLTYLAACRMERIWREQEGFGWSRFALGILGTLIGGIVFVLPFVAMHIDRFRDLFAADPFAVGNLQAEVHWSGIECIAGLVLVGSMIAAHFLHAAARYRSSLLVSFGGTLLFTWATLFFFVQRIEAYSQRAAVEFFRSKAGTHGWLQTYGYKSYVPEFYGRITEALPPDEQLRQGPIDRPVFLSCKVTHAEEVEALGTFHELYRKNGFVFYERLP